MCNDNGLGAVMKGRLAMIIVAPNTKGERMSATLRVAYADNYPGGIARAPPLCLWWPRGIHN